MAVELLLFCRDPYFLMVFSNLLSDRYREFSVYSFTEYEPALHCLSDGKRRIGAILADADFFDVPGLPGDAVRICLSDDTVMSENGVSSLNIFQKRGDIVDDLRRILVGSGALRAERACAQAGMTAFFSTEGGSGKSTLAYFTAVAAAEKGKAVYLNLEESPCLAGLYASRPPVNSEEFLVAVKDRGDFATWLLPALHRSEHGVYVLPVAGSVADRQALTRQDVEFLLDGLFTAAGADHVIADLSCGFSEINCGVMARSRLVALVYSDSRAGAERYRALMADPGVEALPFFGRACLVGNRCVKKYTDGRYPFMTPVSKSIADGADAATVLSANREVRDVCAGLLALAAREDAHG